MPNTTTSITTAITITITFSSNLSNPLYACYQFFYQIVNIEQILQSSELKFFVIFYLNQARFS